MSKFAIVTTQRTGTTFFLTCLDSHPQIQCAGTIFPQVNKFKFFRFDRKGSVYHRYRNNSLRRQLMHWFQRRQSVYNCLNDQYHQSNGVSALGFKVSYNHMESYPAIVTWLREHEIKIIHFVRHNLLKRYVSQATMRARGLAHSTKTVQPVKVRLQIGKLEKELARRVRIVEKYRRTFIDGPYLEVSYESFVANREAETRRILQFLDIDRFMPLASDLKKLNPDSLEDIIENYEEVALVLKGTSYEKYLAM